MDALADSIAVHGNINYKYILNQHYITVNFSLTSMNRADLLKIQNIKWKFFFFIIIHIEKQLNELFRRILEFL